jgi:hypothetical protein
VLKTAWDVNKYNKLCTRKPESDSQLWHNFLFFTNMATPAMKPTRNWTQSNHSIHLMPRYACNLGHLRQMANFTFIILKSSK